VHRSTLVRVRCPDQSQLLGFFHCRSRVCDLYAWVFDTLRATEQQQHFYCGSSSTRDKAVQAFNWFELSISPPRLVLAPFSLRSKRPLSSATAAQHWADESQSLADCQLVPAALLTLTWKPAFFAHCQSSSLASSTTLTSLSCGAHFRQSLLSSASTQSAKLIPAGVALVESQASIASPAVLQQQREQQQGSSASENLHQEAGRRPAATTSNKNSAGTAKWFKL
jgi:hypothetical protein